MLPFRVLECGLLGDYKVSPRLDNTKRDLFFRFDINKTRYVVSLYVEWSHTYSNVWEGTLLAMNCVANSVI